MDPVVLFFLSSGLFLGWSLGANDAANVFGTAVGSRMIRFSTAAVICAVFVTLGAVISGSGAAHGLGQLGAVNALAGSFVVALSAAVTVYAMTLMGLPVSTTQAVVGAIVGWNLYSGSITDLRALGRIVGTWVACPLLAAGFALVIYRITVAVIRRSKPHMIRLDLVTRLGLVAAGAMGAYSLGANNIANVMGAFIASSPFEDIRVFDVFTLTSIQQLFLVGGLAIAVGTFYSKRVMMTVGGSIMSLSPVGAWVVVVSQSLVLFVFSSATLGNVLSDLGLPRIPLIPVSSSQAVVGAVIGVGLSHGLRGARQVKWRILGGIASGWVSTPLMSAVVCFLLLFVFQNVFRQEVYRPFTYELSAAVQEELEPYGITFSDPGALVEERFAKPAEVLRALDGHGRFRISQKLLIVRMALIDPVEITAQGLRTFSDSRITDAQKEALERLAGRRFTHAWQLEGALAAESDHWRHLPPSRANRHANRLLDSLQAAVREHFRAPPQRDAGL